MKDPKDLKSKHNRPPRVGSGPDRPRTGLNALKARVNVRGLAAIDRRTHAACTLLDWHEDLLRDLGGEPAVTAAQRALVEDAARTKLILDHLDAFLMEQSSLVVKRRRLKGRLLPLVLERMRIADHLMAVLTRLGLERRASKALDLDEYLAQHYAAPAARPARPATRAESGPAADPEDLVAAGAGLPGGSADAPHPVGATEPGRTPEGSE
jgi:hypothetical protein